MRSTAICFLSGIILFLQFETLPDRNLYLLLPLSLIFIRFRLFQFIGVLLLGFIWAFFRADLILSDELSGELEGEKITVTGKVVSLPEQRAYGQRFLFLVDQVVTEQKQSLTSPGLIRLSWNNKDIEIKPGQQWRLSVKLKRPYGFSNPGGFDYEYWLFSQGIRATGYVLTKSSTHLLTESPKYKIDTARYALKQAFYNKRQEQPLTGVLLALLIGDRSHITAAQWDILQQTGTSHLLAISGLHIGLIFSLVFFLTKKLATLSHRTLLWMPAPQLALYGGLFAACLYSALAGFSLPTQRALIMLTVSVLGLLYYRKVPISNILAISLVLVLIIDPFAVYSPGFWLSFLAVGVILFGVCHRTGSKGLWWHWGRAQYLVALALFPPVLFWFQSFALTGFFANLIAIPVVSFLVVPFLLLGSLLMALFPAIAEYFLTMTEFSLQILWHYLTFLSNFTLPDFYLSPPKIWQLLLAMFGVLLFLLPKGIPGKYLGILFFLPMLFSTPPRPVENDVWFSLLDVGQGLSAVIQTQNHVLLFDTGARFSDDFDAGEAVVVPFLKQSGIRHLDMILVSHGDNDHIGGLGSILEQFKPQHLLSNHDSNTPEREIQSTPCHAGHTWRWDGVLFEIFHPPVNSQRALFSGNNASCVLKVTSDTHSILLTGDIEKAAELYLIKNLSDKLSATLLLVPHHGSKTSSSETFIDNVNPNYALVASGYRNRYGFPKKVIMDRYQRRGISLLNTAETGTMFIKLTDKGIVYRSHRASRRRFWHTVP